MQPQTNLFDEIIVDNFAGGGGASTGIEFATGRPVDIEFLSEARLAWNTRAPILSAEEMEMLEGME